MPNVSCICGKCLKCRGRKKTAKWRRNKKYKEFCMGISDIHAEMVNLASKVAYRPYKKQWQQ